jgi:hypothetical protein
MEVADAFSKMADGAEKTALSMEIFGRAGNAIIPILNGGSKAIKTFTAELKAAGAVLDEQMIAKLAEVDDKLDRMKRRWDGAVLKTKLVFTVLVLPFVGGAKEAAVDQQVKQAQDLAYKGTPEFNYEGTRTRQEATTAQIRGLMQDEKRRTAFLEEYAKLFGQELSRQAQAMLGLVEYGPEYQAPKLGPADPTPDQWAWMEQWRKNWDEEQARLKKLKEKAAERARSIGELAALAKIPAVDMTRLADFEDAEARMGELRSKLMSFFQAAGLDLSQFEELTPDDFVNRMGREGRAAILREQAVRMMVERTGMAYESALRLVNTSGIMGKAKALALKLREVTGVGQFQMPGMGANQEPSKLAFPMFDVDDSALAKLEGKLRLVPVFVQKATLEMRKSLSEMSTVMQDIVATAASGVESLMQNMMLSLVDKTTTFKSLMGDLWQGVVQIILAAVAKLITSQVISKLFLMLGALIPGPFGAIFSGIGIVLAGTGSGVTVRAAQEESLESGGGGNASAMSSRYGTQPQAATGQAQQIVTVNVEALDTSTIFGSQTRPMGSMARAAKRTLELEGVFS